MRRRILDGPRLLCAAILLLLAVGCGGEKGGNNDNNNDRPDGGGPDGATCGPVVADQRHGNGPAELLAGPPFDIRPENLGIDEPSIQSTDLVIGGQTVHLITFDATTFEDRLGGAWTHRVVVAAPPRAALRAANIAATAAGTGTLNTIGPGQADPVWGTDHPQWFAGTDEVDHHYLMSYGSVVIDFGIPFVATNVVPVQMPWEDVQLVDEILQAAQANADPCDDNACAGEDINGRRVLTGDEEKMSCLLSATFIRQDPTFEPFFNLAVAHMRLLDAAEHVLNEFYASTGPDPGLHWTRIWSVGSSKRGHQERMLAAIDGRIRGVLVSAADISNFSAFFNAQQELWTGGYSFSAPTLAALLEQPFAETYLDTFDMFRWRPEVLDGVMFVLAVGTNDPLYPLGASLFYADAMPDTFRMLLVPNYRHGHGTVDHVAAFRAMISHGLDSTPWPSVDAWFDEATGRVTAVVTGGPVAEVHLWCTSDLGPANTEIQAVDPDCTPAQIAPADDADMREVVWSVAPMTEAGQNVYEAERPASSLAYNACFVRVMTADEKPATSLPLLSSSLCEASGL